MEGFSALQLTEGSRPLLRGEVELLLREEQERGKRGGSKRPEARIESEDMPLWQALRDCRKSLADEQGVPPYVIFHDATLRDMLRLRPRNPAELLQVSGVGDSKLEKYGDRFLAVIAWVVAASVDWN